MAKNWILSCHGYSDEKTTSIFNVTTRQKYANCRIPTGVELVTYTKQGVSLSMDKGWELWEMLVENSNEAEAERQAHKVKKGGVLFGKPIINYGIAGPHDAADLQGWLSNSGISACGLFEVGNQRAIDTFAVGPTGKKLGDFLNAAKSNKVKRIYYLACQELG